MDTLGIGFIGLGEEDRFHLERFRLRADCRCEAAWVSTQDQAQGAPTHLANRIAPSVESIQQDPTVSVVVIDAAATGGLSAVNTAAGCLQRGQHVIIGFEAFERPEDLRMLAELARSAGRQMFIPTLHRWESAFLGVQSVVDAGILGDIRQIRRISRQYVPAELTPAMDVALESGTALRRLWFRMVDELLAFFDQSVQVVSATNESRLESTTAGEIPTGKSAQFTFADGCMAYLELNRRSLAQVETGWVFEGQLGGLSDRRRFYATADHELVDVPLDFPPTNQNGFYDAVIETLRHGTAFPVTLDSIERVLVVLAEAERKAKTGAL